MVKSLIPSSVLSTSANLTTPTYLLWNAPTEAVSNKIKYQQLDQHKNRENSKTFGIDNRINRDIKHTETFLNHFYTLWDGLPFVRNYYSYLNNHKLIVLRSDT